MIQMPTSWSLDKFKGYTVGYEPFHGVAPTAWLYFAGTKSPLSYGRTVPTEVMLSGLASDTGLPRAFRLYPSFPNPFNSSTTIRYQTAESGQVQLDIFDLTGQRVKSLVYEIQAPGIYELSWDGTNEQGTFVSSGLYLTKLQVGSFSQVKKMLLVK